MFKIKNPLRWIMLTVCILVTPHAHAFAGEGLCFLNSTPELANVGIPILGKLGVKKGVCQGMASIVSAFSERVQFAAHAKPASAEQVTEQLKQLMKDYRHGCSVRTGQVKPMIFTGASSVQELCNQNRELFLKQSILNNAYLASREIAAVLPDFLYHRDRPMTSLEDRTAMAITLASLSSQLAEGKKPLLLVYSHVRSVMKIESRANAANEIEVILWNYDPNYTDLQPYFIRIGKDGLPTSGQPKFWNITPNRGC